MFTKRRAYRNRSGTFLIRPERLTPVSVSAGSGAGTSESGTMADVDGRGTGGGFGGSAGPDGCLPESAGIAG